MSINDEIKAKLNPEQLKDYIKLLKSKIADAETELKLAERRSKNDYF